MSHYIMMKNPGFPSIPLYVNTVYFDPDGNGYTCDATRWVPTASNGRNGDRCKHCKGTNARSGTSDYGIEVSIRESAQHNYVENGWYQLCIYHLITMDPKLAISCLLDRTQGIAFHTDDKAITASWNKIRWIKKMDSMNLRENGCQCCIREFASWSLSLRTGKWKDVLEVCTECLWRNHEANEVLLHNYKKGSQHIVSIVEDASILWPIQREGPKKSVDTSRDYMITRSKGTVIQGDRVLNMALDVDDAMDQIQAEVLEFYKANQNTRQWLESKDPKGPSTSFPDLDKMFPSPWRGKDYSPD